MTPTTKSELVQFSAEYTDRVLSWPAAARELKWWFGLTGDPLSDRPVFLKWQAEDGNSSYLLLENDVPVAYGELWLEPGEAELAHLMVDPARQRQGHGIRLVQELTALAARHPQTDVFLRVHPDNTIALGCYARAGYERMTREEEAEFNAGQPATYAWLRAADSSSELRLACESPR